MGDKRIPAVVFWRHALFTQHSVHGQSMAKPRISRMLEVFRPNLVEVLSYPAVMRTEEAVKVCQKWENDAVKEPLTFEKNEALVTLRLLENERQAVVKCRTV